MITSWEFGEGQPVRGPPAGAAQEREEAILGEAKQVRLRVGVIGLGRLWESRHKPSLARLQDRFRITAVYDQVHRRAELEAEQLGCAACQGLAALVERPDVDVVYLLSPQWFGLHPAHLACAAGKAVYCGLPLAGDPAELERLARRVDESGITFMPEFARRCYPATLRLKELLATSLGPPRLILGHSRLFGFDRYAVPGPTTQIAPAPLRIDPGSYLLDWCAFLMQAMPVSISGSRCQVVPAAGKQRCRARFRELRGRLPWRGDGPDRIWPLRPPSLGRGEPVLAGLGVPGLRGAWRRLARDARADPVVGLDRHP